MGRLTPNASSAAVFSAMASLLVFGACTKDAADEPTFFQGLVSVGGKTERVSADPYLHGKAYFLAGQYGLAIKAFKRALRADPESIASMNALAAAYDRIGRFDLADKYYEAALAVDPTSLKTLNNIGYSYFLRGDGEQAVKYLEMSSDLRTGNQKVATNLNLARNLVRSESERSKGAEIESAETPQTPEPAPKLPRIERLSGRVQLLVTNPATLYRAANAAITAALSEGFARVVAVSSRPRAASLAVRPAKGAALTLGPSKIEKLEVVQLAKPDAVGNSDPVNLLDRSIAELSASGHDPLPNLVEAGTAEGRGPRAEGAGQAAEKALEPGRTAPIAEESRAMMPAAQGAGRSNAANKSTPAASKRSMAAVPAAISATKESRDPPRDVRDLDDRQPGPGLPSPTPVRVEQPSNGPFPDSSGSDSSVSADLNLQPAACSVVYENRYGLSDTACAFTLATVKERFEARKNAVPRTSPEFPKTPTASTKTVGPQLPSTRTQTGKATAEGKSRPLIGGQDPSLTGFLQPISDKFGHVVTAVASAMDFCHTGASERGASRRCETLKQVSERQAR